LQQCRRIWIGFVTPANAQRKRKANHMYVMTKKTTENANKHLFVMVL
jgi:hypothetical protein